MELLIYLLELLGTVAFAISGAMIGLKKNMDIFGVSILGLTTAVGGGLIRDIILGITPPKVFQSSVYILLSMITAVIMFIPYFRRTVTRNQVLYERVLLILDSVGLGVFTVVGVQVGFEATYSLSPLLLIFVGVVTGTGGGLLRDVMAGDMPYIFTKHVYACASIAGAGVCVVLWHAFGRTPAILAGFFTVVVIRLLAAHFHWSLPKASSFR